MRIKYLDCCHGVDQTMFLCFQYNRVQSECKCPDSKRVDMYQRGNTSLDFKSPNTFMLQT